MSDLEKEACRAKTTEVMNQLLESTSKIALVINNKKLDFDRRLHKILKIILDYLGVEHGSIMVRERKHLVVRAATRKEILGYKQPLEGNAISSWVEKSGEPLFVQNIMQDSRFKSSSKGIYKDSELLSVPIHQGNKVIGVINVTDKTGNHGVLKDDIACMLQFSSLVLSLLTQQNMHAELKKQKNRLRQKNKELRRQEEKRAELSRMLIHDLKGPLSEVVANLDILSYSISPQNIEFLEAAQTSCDQAVRMVSNLVNVGRIEDGNMELLKQKIAPATLIEESLSSIKGLARLKDVDLIMDIGDELPDVSVDRILILRVLQNLLNNGLGCSKAGTSLKAGCKYHAQKHVVEFFVQDEGPGIPEDKQQLIFDKYASLACAESGVVGTGLGLYFCKLAVQEHGGTIEIDSVPDIGSRFFFHIPV